MIISYIFLGIVLILCCYLPAFLVFHNRSRAVSFAHLGMYTNVGMGSLGVLAMCARAAGLDMRLCVFPGICMGIYALIRHRRQCLPVMYKTKWDGHIIVALIICLVYWLHILIPGILMGYGNYPHVFFDVDSAYYMGQIHALLRDVSWPPISLDFAGEQTGYHYGAQCLCAVLSQLTGILPHTVAFIIYMPLTALGIISASWLLVQSNLPDRLLLWLGLALLLFQCFYPLYKVGFIINSFHDWGQQFLQLFLDPETLNGGYPMLSSYYGVFLTLTLLICLQNLSDFGALRLAAFAVGIMVLYKSPYMVTVGLGLGLCISWHLLFTRQKRAALAFMAFPLAYLLHALMLLSSTVSLVVLFGHLIANKRLWVDVLGTMAVYSIPIFVLWRTRKLQFKNAGTWYPLVFVVASIIFANVFGLVRKEDNLEFGTGIDQTVHLTPVFLAVFLVGNLQEYWMDLTRNKRFLVICMVLSITLFPIIHNIFESGVYLFSPEIGHEYVDNRPLAEALQHIPLENSRIVVNDFHYPAQNYRRDFRQMQIPALFGHQAYAVNFEYVHYPESKYRLEIQQRFRAAKWDAGLEQIAQKLGWTDLIIFRNFPHPDDIPLPLMFENNLCQVYSFK